jgi:DNA-binding XRE family transcriptional regulator
VNQDRALSSQDNPAHSDPTPGDMPDPFRPVKHKLYISYSFSYRVPMISPAQIRAARGLLRWTQATLAHRAAVSTVTLNMIENEAVRPRGNTLSAIQDALEAAGIELLGDDGSGVGVRFRQGERV